MARVLHYLHVQGLLHKVERPLDVHYKEAVRSVIRLSRAAAARNLRGRALLNYVSNLRLANPRFSRTSRLAELYDRWFYRPISYDPDTGIFRRGVDGRGRILPSASLPRMACQATSLRARIPAAPRRE